MAETPLVWLLLGDKKGDNGQVWTIEKSLVWPSVLKHIVVLDEFVFGKPKVGPTLYHINCEASDPLEPPWPDLILTVGRRPANVALWVKQQSGGQAKIVLVGKPSGCMDQFDLIVASAENRFPPRENVLPISLPLMRIDEQAVKNGAEAWAQRLGSYPKPLIGVMVGGPTNPYVFRKSVVRKMIEVANDIVAQGGTPYFTTSRRTPPATVEQLKKELPSQAVLYEWSADAKDNPYMGLLGLADGFIVTGDSISMMVEVVRLGKPLVILDLPTSLIGSIDQLRRSMARWIFAPVGDSPGEKLRGAFAQLVYSSGFIRHTRDFRAFHEMLIKHGLAVPMGEKFSPPSGTAPDDASLVVEKIRQLLA